MPAGGGDGDGPLGGFLPFDVEEVDGVLAVFLDDVEARWTSERFAEDEAALQAWWDTAA